MELLFVYNAKSGKLNALFDACHKLLRPSTYPCSLCALTYATFSERSTWKNFKNESHFTMIFYYKDEFEEKFPNQKMVYPSVLKFDGNTISTVLTHELLDEISSAEALIAKLKTCL